MKIKNLKKGMYLAANYQNNTTHIARRITVFPHYSIRHTTQLIRCLQHVSTAAAPEMPRTTSFTSHHRALVLGSTSNDKRLHKLAPFVTFSAAASASSMVLAQML